MSIDSEICKNKVKLLTKILKEKTERIQVLQQYIAQNNERLLELGINPPLQITATSAVSLQNSSFFIT